MSDYFAIGFRGDQVTKSNNLCPQLVMVLDNAIMHNRYASRVVWMRILGTWLAVGRPTGMRYTGITDNGIFLHDRFKTDDLANHFSGL